MKGKCSAGEKYACLHCLSGICTNGNRQSKCFATSSLTIDLLRWGIITEVELKEATIKSGEVLDDN